METLFSVRTRKRGFVCVVLLGSLLILWSIYGLSNHEEEYTYQVNAFSEEYPTIRAATYADKDRNFIFSEAQGDGTAVIERTRVDMESGEERSFAFLVDSQDLEGWQRIKIEDPALNLARKQLYGGLIIGIMSLFVSAIIYFPYALFIWRTVGRFVRVIGSLFLVVLMISSCVAFSEKFAYTMVYSTSILESGLIGTRLLIQFVLAIFVFGSLARALMPEPLKSSLLEE